jgi:Flp pilus assembly protein TadD
MASLEEAAGSANNAISLYERHLELFPSDAQAMNNLAYLLTEHTDRHAEAVQLSLNSIALREFAPANVLDTLAWALFHEGSMERARGLAELALRTLPQESAATPDPETERVMLLHLQTIEMAIEGAAALESPANPQTQRRRRRRTP